MTTDELQQLSQRVAEKYGIPAWIGITKHHKIWLFEDSERCFDLAVEHRVCLTTLHSAGAIVTGNVSCEDYADHPTKQQAVRVAILRALERK